MKIDHKKWGTFKGIRFSKSFVNNHTVEGSAEKQGEGAILYETYPN